jgi:hypothetical protein
MKTSKLRTISGMFALALIVTLALTACPADTNSGETPTAQSGKANMTVDGTAREVIIKGTFKNSEWTPIYNKVKSAVENVVLKSASNGKITTIYDTKHEQITITVVSGGADDYYEVTGHEIKLSLSFINKTTTLAGDIGTLIEDDITAQAPTPTRIAKATQTQRSI